MRECSKPAAKAASPKFRFATLQTIPERRKVNRIVLLADGVDGCVGEFVAIRRGIKILQQRISNLRLRVSPERANGAGLDRRVLFLCQSLSGGFISGVRIKPANGGNHLEAGARIGLPGGS